MGIRCRVVKVGIGDDDDGNRTTLAKAMRSMAISATGDLLAVTCQLDRNDTRTRNREQAEIRRDTLRGRDLYRLER